MPLRMLISNIFNIQTDLAFNEQQAVQMFSESFKAPCKCRDRSYKFIFMDIQMPVMDGLEASEKILEITREAGEDDYCHIVALTSYTQPAVKDKALDIGVKELLNKPLETGDLQKMVHLHFYRRSESSLKANAVLPQSKKNQ